VAGRAEDDARARGDSAGRVGGKIVAAGVGFGLDDDAGGRAVNDDFAEKVARYFDGVALVEGGRIASFVYCRGLSLDGRPCRPTGAPR
jgi:hypothetical protein